MSRWKKWLIGSIIVGCVLLLFAGVLVKVYATPEKIRDLLKTGLEESLHRRVSLGELKVGIFSGIKLQQLRIDAKSGSSALLVAENIEISYDPMSLLKGEIMFGRILIREPKLRLVRDVTGVLNVADLLSGQPVTTGPEPVPEVSSGNSTDGNIPLLVKEFKIEGGTLHFIDRRLNPQSPYLYRLENLNVTVDDFSLDHPFTAYLAATFNDASLSAELQFDFDAGLSEMQLHGDNLDLIPLSPYLQDVFPGKLGQGLLSTELLLKQQQKGLLVRGQVALDQADISLEMKSPLHWKQVHIAVDQDVFYRFADQVLDVKKMQIEVNGTQADYIGKVSLTKSVQFAGEMNLKLPDLRKLTELLPIEIRDQVAAYGTAGSIDATLQLAGTPDGIELVQQAHLTVKNLQASFGAFRPAINGAFDYSEQQVRGQKIKLKLKGQQFMIDLDAKHLMAIRPDLNLMVSGNKLDIDGLLAAEQSSISAKAAEANSTSVITPAKSSPLPLVLPFAGRTDFIFSQVLYQGLTLSDVKGRAQLRNEKLSLEKLTAKLADGSLELSASSDLADPLLPFQGRFKITNLNLGPVADALLPKGKGSTRGVLLASGHFSGHAVQTDLLAGISSTGQFDLVDGEIKGSPLFSGLAKFLTNPGFEVLGFSRFHGKYGLAHGQGTIDARLEGRQARITPKGTFSLNGPLNLSLETRIAPETMARVGVGGKGADLFKDEIGWSLFPLKVKGSYSHPIFTFDSTGVKKQLKKSLTRELGHELQKQLGGKGGAEGAPPIQELLDGALKQLFGN